MNALAVLNSKPVAIVAGVAVGALALYLIGRKLVTSVPRVIDEFNQGTPYEGAGAVGAAGNIANQVSGGILADFGGWLGGKVYDLTHPEYDPNK